MARRDPAARFDDRADAGQRLAPLLSHLAGTDAVVLGLPRGGVPVAHEVAAALDLPLDVIVVRKLGVPWHSELAMGAIGEDGVRVINADTVRHAGVSETQIRQVETAERAELERRVAAFRGDRPARTLAGKTAVIVDDGIATGSTAEAACQVARAKGASRVVMAAPVAAPRAVEMLNRVADEVTCLQLPADLGAIGFFYRDFTQTTDGQVRALLDRAPT